MIHKIVSSIGLGILGIDPITAVYLLAMGLKNERKTKITLFFLSFAGFSIFLGAALAAIFGVAAIDFLKSIMPSDSSLIWAILKFAISVFILVWVFKKLFQRNKKAEKQKKETISGNNFKYITTGLVFAVASFTDPTFYAVILTGGESGNIFTAILLLTIWFAVSQFMAVITYVANELNLLELLIVDTGFYLFNGRYLF